MKTTPALDASGKGCIYKITNLETNRVYIGMTTSPHWRWITHKSKLRQRKHSNKSLQAEWTQYGESAFDFDILEWIDTRDNRIIGDRELYRIDVYSGQIY